MLIKSWEELIVDYEFFALTRYKDNTQKPYCMAGELPLIKSDVYLIEGDNDILFPYEKSIANAKSNLAHLKEVTVFPNVGHGIETYAHAIA